MVLFTTQSVRRLDGVADVMAPAEALERMSRTVKQVRIPVHGAINNPMALMTQPTCTVGANPKRSLPSAPKRLMVGVQPTPGLGALRAAAQGMRDRRSAAEAQAPTTPSRHGRWEMRH